MKIQQCLQVEDCQFKFSVFQQTKEANRLKVNKKILQYITEKSLLKENLTSNIIYNQTFYLSKYQASYNTHTGNRLSVRIKTSLWKVSMR